MLLIQWRTFEQASDMSDVISKKGILCQPVELFPSLSQLGEENEHLFNNHICILHSET